jgi:hypothetical protein
VQELAIRCALSFLQDVARVVILVTAFETNATIRARDFSGRKAASVVELITNGLTNFAIRICCRGHCCMLRVVEVVNSA